MSCNEGAKISVRSKTIELWKKLSQLTIDE